MKLVDADTALAHVESRRQVFVHGAAATPTALLDAIARRAKDVLVTVD